MTFNRASRELDIRGRIDLTDGSAIELTSDNVFSYSINENNASSGFPLGSTSAGNYSLTINNVGKRLDSTVFDGAKVTVEIGLRGEDGEYAYSPFGQWYASNLAAPEQSVNATVTGYDALSVKFGAVFKDSADGYPCTLKDLFEDVCRLAGVAYRTSLFVNSDKPVSGMPNWADGVTLRDVLGYIAACAGGFARIARDGLLEIVPFGRTLTHSLNPDGYFQFTPKDGVPFQFNALQAKIGDAETYTRFAIDDSVEDNATNTIRVDSNPLMTEEMAWVIVAALNGFTAIGSTFSWQGDPAVCLGDKVTVTDVTGKTWTSILNKQQINFSGGLRFSSSCSIPTLTRNTGGSYQGASSPFNADGTINANRVTGIDKVVANSAKFKETAARLQEAESKLEQAGKDLEQSKEDISSLTKTVESKVSKTEYNSLANKVTTNETSIQQNAEAIKSKASSESVEVLRGTVTTLETTVGQQADQIALKAEREDVDTLNAKVSENEAAIRLNAEEINSRVEQEVSQLNSVLAEKADSATVSQIATEFNQTSSSLEARVEATENGITTLQTGVTVDENGVTIQQPGQTNNSMVLRAGSMTINAPGREALVASPEDTYAPKFRCRQFTMGNLVTTVTGTGEDCRIVEQYIAADADNIHNSILGEMILGEMILGQT